MDATLTFCGGNRGAQRAEAGRREHRECSGKPESLAPERVARAPGPTRVAPAFLACAGTGDKASGWEPRRRQQTAIAAREARVRAEAHPEAAAQGPGEPLSRLPFGTLPRPASPSGGGDLGPLSGADVRPRLDPLPLAPLPSPWNPQALTLPLHALLGGKRPEEPRLFTQAGPGTLG